MRLWVLLILFISSDLLAATSNCADSVNTGDKAWQVVQKCGKPNTLSYKTLNVHTSQSYQIYSYSISEAVCYTQIRHGQVICEHPHQGNVKFYIQDDTIKNINMSNKDIDNLFLNYNHRIVLGDDKDFLVKLWGKPDNITTDKLTLPVREEIWIYPQGPNKKLEIDLKDGVVVGKRL